MTTLWPGIGSLGLFFRPEFVVTGFDSVAKICFSRLDRRGPDRVQTSFTSKTKGLAVEIQRLNQTRMRLSIRVKWDQSGFGIQLRNPTRVRSKNMAAARFERKIQRILRFASIGDAVLSPAGTAT